jgi:TPR repeat protein
VRKVPLQVLDVRTTAERRLEEAELENARLLELYTDLTAEHAELERDYRIALAYLADIAFKGDPLASVARTALEHLGAKPAAVAEASL